MKIHYATISRFILIAQELGDQVRHLDPGGSYSELWLLDGDYINHPTYSNMIALADGTNFGWQEIDPNELRQFVYLLGDMAESICWLEASEEE